MENTTSTQIGWHYMNLFDRVYQIFTQSEECALMQNTIEDSPWHREASTWVHTSMVIEEFINRSPTIWDKHWFAGAVAALFHDVGKPKCLVWKFKEERGHYKAFYGHEKESARIFVDMVFQNPTLRNIFDELGEDILFITAWMIEYHLPWDIKDSKKRDALMKTCSRYLGDVEVFTTLLLSDTYGRISDDQDAKRTKANAWVKQFHEDYSGCKDYFEYLNGVSRDNNITKPVAYFLIGPSGSGKSTFRNQIVTKYPDAGQFSLDDLRTDLYGDDYEQAFKLSCEDKKFKWIAKERFVNSIRNNKSKVYVHDNTSRTKRARNTDIIELQNRGYYVIAVVFMTSLKTVLKRQHTRTDKMVPDAAVISQFYSVELPSIGEVDGILTIFGE